jgi:hypothetical protein
VGTGDRGSLGVGVELLPGLLTDVEELIPGDGSPPSSGAEDSGEFGGGVEGPGTTSGSAAGAPEAAGVAASGTS